MGPFERDKGEMVFQTCFDIKFGRKGVKSAWMALRRVQVPDRANNQEFMG